MTTGISVVVIPSVGAFIVDALIWPVLWLWAFLENVNA